MFRATICTFLVLAISSITLHATSEPAGSQGLTANGEAIVRELLLEYDADFQRMGKVARHADYAVLAWAAYSPAGRGKQDAALKFAEERGWSPVGKPIVRQSKDAGATVARVFEKDDMVVVSFRGTAVKDDWITNWRIALPFLSTEQVTNAAEIGKEIVAKYVPESKKGYRSVTFVGHSLGGRMAQIARLATGKQASVFNTAPLALQDLPDALKSNVHYQLPFSAFRSPQDPLEKIDPSSFMNTEVANITRASLMSSFRVRFPDRTSAGDEQYPFPDFGTAGSTPSEIEFDNTFFEYAHSIEVLARAMQNVRDAWVGDSLNAYLSSPDCRLPVKSSSRGKACPRALRNAPKRLTVETECNYGQCQDGSRWKTLRDVQLFELTDGDFKPLNGQYLKTGSWITSAGALDTGQRLLGVQPNGTPKFVYIGMGEGCFKAWSGTREETVCDVQPIFDHSTDDQTFIRFEDSSERNLYARLFGGHGLGDKRWTSASELHSDLAKMIASSYSDSADGLWKGAKSKRDLALLVKEIDRHLEREAELNGHGTKQGYSMRGAMGRAADFGLLEALVERGWKAPCPALFVRGIDRLEFLESALQYEPFQHCDHSKLLFNALGGLLDSDSRDPDRVVAYVELLLKHGVDINSPLANNRTIIQLLSDRKYSKNKNAQEVRSRLIAIAEVEEIRKREEVMQKAVDQRIDAEIEWMLKWEMDLNGKHPWENVADLLHHFPARTVDILSGGHKIIIQIDDVSFGDGQTIATGFSRETNIYSDFEIDYLERLQSGTGDTWDNWFNAIDQISNYEGHKGVRVSCRLPPKQAAKLTVDDRFIFRAKLKSYQGNSASFDCKLVGPE